MTLIHEYNDRKISKSHSSELTQKLKGLYFEAVHGHNERYMGWLDCIY